MMTGKPVKQEEISISMVVNVPYRFAAGKYMSKYLRELKENGKFFGIRCPSCGRVQMPPRVVCASCHVENKEWVELGQEGTVCSFTIMYIPLTDPTTGKPHNPPFAYVSVKLDGCDSPLDHLMNVEPSVANLHIGMRARVMLRPRDQRIGDLSDILYFEPIDG
jgi:uncharacterized protein